MIKKFIMKLIRGNKDLREFVINGCITEDLLLPEQKAQVLDSMEFHTTISDEYLSGKSLILNNCLFINTRIQDNKIQGDFKIINPFNTYISNNIGISVQNTEKEEVNIPEFMKK